MPEEGEGFGSVQLLTFIKVEKMKSNLEKCVLKSKEYAFEEKVREERQQVCNNCQKETERENGRRTKSHQGRGSGGGGGGGGNM